MITLLDSSIKIHVGKTFKLSYLRASLYCLLPTDSVTKTDEEKRKGKYVIQIFVIFN